jgi:hypothetical protein
MQCIEVKDLLIHYLNSELEEAEAQKVCAHLVVCAGCSEELRSLEATLSLLYKVDEIAVSASLLDSLRGQVRRVRRVPIYRRSWFYSGVAVAASLLVMLSIWLIQRGPEVTPPRFTRTEAFTKVRLPNGGLLRAAPRTSFILAQDRIELKEGELFIDVRARPEGFTVVAGDTRAEVLGTKFGIKATRIKRSGSMLVSIYVVEGEVRLSNRLGSVIVGPGGVAYAKGDTQPVLEVHPEARFYSSIAWLKRKERFSPIIKVRVLKDVFTDRDDGVRLKVIISNPTILPILMEAWQEIPPPYMSFRLFDEKGEKYLVKLEGWMVEDQDAPSRSNGLVILAPGETYSLDCQIPLNFFRHKGIYRLKAVYTSGRATKDLREKGVWTGSLGSDLALFEIK